MTTSVHIVATGARTSLGMQALASAIALRAGISSMGDHPYMIDQVGDPMPGALDSELDACIIGAERFVTLAESALRETCSILESLNLSSFDIPLYLGLPEYRPGFTTEDAQKIKNRISNLKDLPVDLSEVKVITEGNASGLAALAAATEHIYQGQIKVCLVGGVESYFHPDTMEWLDENRQLANSVSRSGFIPGEGAGFCLLMSKSVYRTLGLNSLAKISGIAVDRENKLIKTDDICLGEGLTKTVKKALSGLQLPDQTVSDIYCDINGERYRGEEWGFVCLRLPLYFDAPTAYNSPAGLWGDMGAASGPLFAMLACQDAADDCSVGSRTLLWASSEKGMRSAVVLETNIVN